MSKINKIALSENAEVFTKIKELVIELSEKYDSSLVGSQLISFAFQEIYHQADDKEGYDDLVEGIKEDLWKLMEGANSSTSSAEILSKFREELNKSMEKFNSLLNEVFKNESEEQVDKR